MTAPTRLCFLRSYYLKDCVIIIIWVRTRAVNGLEMLCWVFFFFKCTFTYLYDLDDLSNNKSAVTSTSETQSNNETPKDKLRQLRISFYKTKGANHLWSAWNANIDKIVMYCWLNSGLCLQLKYCSIITWQLPMCPISQIHCPWVWGLHQGRRFFINEGISKCGPRADSLPICKLFPYLFAS